MMVIMAIVTTAMTGPLLDALGTRELVAAEDRRDDQQRAERRGDGARGRDADRFAGR
jgi:hypothetical protein